jgi:hypothetical protein
MHDDANQRRGRTVVDCDICGDPVPMRIGQSGPGAKPTHPRCR